jgi:hypothetical protein
MTLLVDAVTPVVKPVIRLTGSMTVIRETRSGYFPQQYQGVRIQFSALGLPPPPSDS